MHRPVYFVLLSAVIACGSETQFGNDADPVGMHNPPELESAMHTDRVIQQNIEQVDVMWVIDNSCSMSCVVGCHGAVSEEVAKNFPAFMDYFSGSGLDYHIGVITTDMSDPNHKGKLQSGLGYPFIDVYTPDPIGVFYEMATQGTSGSGTEEGTLATYTAIEELDTSVNAGFYRERARLHTIVLSNEPDRTEPNELSKQEFVSWYDGLKNDREDRTFSAIVCTGTSTDICSDGISDDYMEIAAALDGIIWDIGREDWAALLDQLGEMASAMKREYYLSEIPVPGTIAVKVKDGGTTFSFEEAQGDPPVGDWIYDSGRNSITFIEYLPAPLAEVLITYERAEHIQDDE